MSSVLFALPPRSAQNCTRKIARIISWNPQILLRATDTTDHTDNNSTDVNTVKLTTHSGPLKWQIISATAANVQKNHSDTVTNIKIIIILIDKFNWQIRKIKIRFESDNPSCWQNLQIKMTYILTDIYKISNYSCMINKRKLIDDNSWHTHKYNDDCQFIRVETMQVNKWKK